MLLLIGLTLVNTEPGCSCLGYRIHVPMFFYVDKESVEYKAFNRFYNELITVLYDKSYLTHFIASGTISVHDVHHISDLPENDRAMHLLKYISAPLEYSEKQSFYKMLEIMKTHGNLYAMELAENIETFISEVDSATLHYTEGMYVNKMRILKLIIVLCTYAYRYSST